MRLIHSGSFINETQVVNPTVGQWIAPVYYLILALGLLILVLQCRQWDPVVFGCTAFAMALMITEIIISYQVNVPINKAINVWLPGSSGDINALRERWIYFIKWRGVLSGTAFRSLLVGALFGMR